MNERIKELEKQCWSHYVNGVLIDGHLHFDTQKFAELIVAECCDMMIELEPKYPANLTVREIRKHFGVEE